MEVHALFPSQCYGREYRRIFGEDLIGLIGLCVTFGEYAKPVDVCQSSVIRRGNADAKPPPENAFTNQGLPFEKTPVMLWVTCAAVADGSIHLLASV